LLKFYKFSNYRGGIMTELNSINRCKLSAVLITAVTTGSLLISVPLHAQVLEEIIVTAERRVQTLQEVPISIEVTTAEEISLQGYKNLDDLSKFTASVTIVNNVQEQNVAIRGFSTRGNSMTTESAAPVFLDGVHYGRMSMIKSAFLDPEQVEILKGPQPLHFGMNATAGAISIRSKRPTAEWEGDMTTELANDASFELSGGFGGPLTETLGIRMAGVYEGSEGQAINRFNPTEKISHFNHLAGRLSLEWTPTDQLSIFTKLERSKQRNGGDIGMGCLTGATISGFADAPLEGENESLQGLQGGEFSSFAPPPLGIGVAPGIIPPQVVADPKDCFKGNLALSRGGPYQAMPYNMTSGQASRVLGDGAVDGRAVMDAFYRSDAGVGNLGIGGNGDTGGLQGHDDVDNWNGLIDINYQFAGGINLNSQTGWVKSDRLANRDFRDGPYLGGLQKKFEYYDQWSQLLQLNSPAEGYDLTDGINMEFMAQANHQYGSIDFSNGNSEASGLRRVKRFNNGWEDARWNSAAWQLTFNVMDDQLSLSVGGRYTDVKKDVAVSGWGATYIFDQRPCDSSGVDSDVATCATDPDFKRVHPTLTTETYIDPITGRGSFGSRPDRGVRIDSPQLLLPGVDLDNLWTINQWDNRAIIAVPLNYRGGRVPAVGLTAPVFANQDGPCRTNVPPASNRCVYNERLEADNYSSQVVLSYTPNALMGDHTFYGKFVESFKGPVTDTAQATLPASFLDLLFTPEFVTGFEVGSKGMLFDSRARYDVAAFNTTFKDLQTAGAAAPFNPSEQRSISLNAGKQEVTGFEFNIEAAATQNLTLSLGGAFMDAEFKDFEGSGCSNNELIAVSIDAITPQAQGGSLESRSAAEIAAANANLNRVAPGRRAALPSRAELPEEFFGKGAGCSLVDSPEFAAGTTNIGGANTASRSGARPQDTPTWRLVAGANYELPVMDNYFWFVNVKGQLADAHYRGRSADIAPIVSWPVSGDINLSTGIGPQDGSWRLVAFARNLLEARPVYNPEFNLIDEGFVDVDLSRSAFRSYGVRFNYNFQ